MLAATIASSVIQPLFGHISDRRSLPWLMPLGPALGGLGVGLIGISPSYAFTFVAVVVGGIGVAAFHPEGSRFANYVSGARRSSGMSLFSVGGNIGFALGPVLVRTPLVLISACGDPVRDRADMADGGSCWPAAAATEAVSAPTSSRAGACSGPSQAPRPGTVHHPRRRDRAALVHLLRSVTFIPLYFVHDLHTSKAFAARR